MKTLNWTRKFLFGLVLLAGFASPASFAAMPSGEYACQVVTAEGGMGLVLVQADTRELAQKAALGAEAFTNDHMRSRATKIVQCISRADEKFADYQFQQFFESVPL